MNKFKLLMFILILLMLSELFLCNSKPSGLSNHQETTDSTFVHISAPLLINDTQYVPTCGNIVSYITNMSGADTTQVTFHYDTS